MGRKRAFLRRHVRAIRARLEPDGQLRDLALPNLAIDSMLRGGDLVRRKVPVMAIGITIRECAAVIQSWTARPVRFEVTESRRQSISDWIDAPQMAGACLFPDRSHASGHISPRPSARVVKGWIRRFML